MCIRDSYYPPGSLKADLCLEGRERLYAWCARHGVGHRRIGKLLVAVEENERERLQALAANARACGVDDLMPLDGTTLLSLIHISCSTPGRAWPR